MSKKKFTDGLESLFGETTEATESFQEENPLLAKKKKRKSNSGRSLSGKNFTADLDCLFEDALTETIAEKVNKIAKNTTQEKNIRAKKRINRPLGGLDALIRKTSDMEEVKINTPNKKRVTFTFDKTKLQKLKSIAKKEKQFLKDIIGGVVAEFIEEYEKMVTDRVVSARKKMLNTHTMNAEFGQ